MPLLKEEFLLNVCFCFFLPQVRDRQGLKVNGVAPPDEPLESFKPSRSLKEYGFVKNRISVCSLYVGVHDDRVVINNCLREHLF